MKHKTLFFLCLIALASSGLLGEDTHPFSVHDMLAMERISDPQVSPDGKSVVFTLRTTDMENNRGRTNLWLLDMDSRQTRLLTTHQESDFNPRWSPDSRYVWFLSTRSGSSQVWRIRAEGGEARQMTDLPLDAGNLLVSPDGRTIAFTLDIFLSHPSPGETREELDRRKNRKASGQVYNQLFIRHWDTWENGRRSHLFVMNPETQDLIDVMAGMDADTPSQPFGGPEEITFTPDSRSLIFTAKNAGREQAWSTNFDLYLAPADAGRPPENLTDANPAWDTTPVFSPDGGTLAYLAMDRAGYESDRFRIVLMPWPEGSPRVLTENWDRSPSSLCWAPDGRRLYATAANLGQHSLFAVDIESGKAATTIKDGTIQSPSFSNGRLIFGRDTLHSPVELFSSNPDGGDIQKLTRVNDTRAAAARMGEYEHFTFSGWENETVYAYVVKPVDFDPDKSYPVAFLIHGGPQGSFGNHFHYRWNPQAYAGAGYAAVMVDFHGSVGYGQDFTDSIRGDWGGKPLTDLKKGLAAALEKYPWMDGERAAALGASFGGYMINWIAGQWPDRFRCLVNHDGNLDERFAYFATEELWFPEWDHRGTPWTNPEGYEKHNPVRFVDKWKTPMLVIHGAQDYRVVLTQGIATFTALQRRGVPSRFLYFPDENHWVLKPRNSILWHDTVIDWLDKWCGF
ncbi:MAG: S9 family peptidase [Candidatus Aminicenantes bacterium]